MSTDSPRNPVPIAALWMIGTILSLSLMAVCGRELGAYMSPFVILFFRSLFGLLIMTSIVLYQYKRIRHRHERHTSAAQYFSLLWTVWMVLCSRVAAACYRVRH